MTKGIKTIKEKQVNKKKMVMLIW